MPQLIPSPTPSQMEAENSRTPTQKAVQIMGAGQKGLASKVISRSTPPKERIKPKSM